MLQTLFMSITRQVWETPAMKGYSDSQPGVWGTLKDKLCLTFKSIKLNLHTILYIYKKTAHIKAVKSYITIETFGVSKI